MKHICVPDSHDMTLAVKVALNPNTTNQANCKLKAFADNKLNDTQNIKFVYHRVEIILGKGENAGYQHVPFSHNVFNELFPEGRMVKG